MLHGLLLLESKRLIIMLSVIDPLQVDITLTAIVFDPSFKELKEDFLKFFDLIVTLAPCLDLRGFFTWFDFDWTIVCACLWLSDLGLFWMGDVGVNWLWLT